MFRTYDRGASVLGGEFVAPMHVRSVNVPVYLKVSDAPTSDLGEPVATLQMGDLVDAVGPSVKNPKGAPFTPVTVRGREGVYWVRSTSVEENAPLQPVAAKSLTTTTTTGKSPKMRKGMPWWGWGLVGLGVVAAGGTYWAVKS